MICPPCQQPHAAADCVDNQVKPPREYPYRHCFCQHRPRPEPVEIQQADVEGMEAEQPVPVDQVDE